MQNYCNYLYWSTMYTYVSVYIINNKLLLLEVVELFIEDKLSDKYRHFFPLLVPCLFSENTPFLHGFFLNNEGYSAWDCKLFAWIAHGLIMSELHVRCECVGHICVDLVEWLVGWKRVPRICGWGGHHKNTDPSWNYTSMSSHPACHQRSQRVMYCLPWKLIMWQGSWA